MAYFLQDILSGDWTTRLAIVELMMWVAMFSLIFLGRHENKDQIRLLTAQLAERDAEIATLKAQLAPPHAAKAAAAQ